MRKLVTISLACICITLSGAAASADSAATQSPPPKKSLHLASVPKAIAGFCAGFVVGVPVCFAKKLPQEAIEGARGVLGSISDKAEDNKFLLGTTFAICLVPAGLVTCLDAPMYSLRNAWMADKPFSKEQFSLTELDK